MSTRTSKWCEGAAWFVTRPTFISVWSPRILDITPMASVAIRVEQWIEMVPPISISRIRHRVRDLEQAEIQDTDTFVPIAIKDRAFTSDGVGRERRARRKAHEVGEINVTVIVIISTDLSGRVDNRDAEDHERP